MKDHLLFTGLGAGNIGDEAMFAGFLSGYSLSPGTTVEVYDARSPFVEGLPQQFTYIDQRDRESCRKAALSARRVLLACGTPVMEDWGLEWPMRFLGAELDYLVDRGCEVHALGVGVDPLASKEGVELFRKSFGRIETWTVRSAQCRRALLELGVADRKIHVAADLAWLFTPKGEKGNWAEGFWRELGIDASGPLIAVNVVNERWAGPTEAKTAIALGLDEAVRRTGIQVAFICNEAREGDYFDAAAAREVAGLMAGNAALVPAHHFTPSEMCALLGYCALTLSQRYHFTLLSILSGTVPLSFSRGWKMAGLLGELGEEPVGDMESCSPGVLTGRIEHALSKRAEIRERQQATARCLRTRAGENFVFLNSRPSANKPKARLASVSQLESLPFSRFMEMLNKLASSWGLRQFTNWSKVWEYPWVWYNGLRRLDWPGLKLLDLGSELSPMPWYLAGLGAQVTLVEPGGRWVPDWERVRNSSGLNPQWHIGAGGKLPFPDCSFDVVTSFSVIEHQADKAGAVSEAARVLKPGGMFAVSFDICEPEMGMTFPEWNGRALTMKEFEELVWSQPAFAGCAEPLEWNVQDCEKFIQWHLQSASHHNYTVGAAVLWKREAA